MFRLLLRSIDDAVLVCDGKGMILGATRQASKVLGQPVSSLKKKSITVFFPHVLREQIRKYFSPRSRTGAVSAPIGVGRPHAFRADLRRSESFVVCTLRRIAGSADDKTPAREARGATVSRLPLDRSATPLDPSTASLDELGASLTAGYARGKRSTTVSRLRSAERSFRATTVDDRLQLISNAFLHSDDPIAITDLRGKILFANSSHERHRAAVREVLGKKFDHTIHHFSPQIISATITAGRWSGEQRYRMKDGSETVVLLTTSLVTDTDGVALAVLGVERDISERKRREFALRESEHLYHNVVETMGDAALLTDLQGRILDVNAEFEKLTRYAKSEVLGLQFPYPWLVEEDMAKYVTWISELRARNYMHDFDMRWMTKDRRQVPISLNTTLLRNDRGGPVAMLNIARDITERKKLSDALEIRSRQIEMLNRIISRAHDGMMNDEVLQYIFIELSAFFTFDHLSIMLLDHTRQFLSVYGVVHRVEGYLKRGSRFPLTSSLARLPIELMKPVVLNDLEREDSEVKGTIGYRKGIRSILSVPILFQGIVIGAFSLSSNSKHVFSENALPLLQPIVEQIGVSIEKTRLYTELLNSEEKYRLLVETARDLVISLDLDGRFQYVSPSAFSITGYTVEELQTIGLTEKTVYPPDYSKVVALLRLLRTSRTILTEVKNLEFRLIHKDGTLLWVSISWTLIFNDDGSIGGVHGILHDITERKTAEEKINKQLNQLNVLYDFSRRITSSLDPREIGELTFSFAEKIVPFEEFAIDTYDDSRSCLIPLVSVVTSGGHMRLMHHSVEPIVLDRTSALFLALIEKRSVMVNAVEPEHGDFVRIRGGDSAPPGAFIFVPMYSKERILGALWIRSAVPDVYTADHLHLIESLANLAALAIEKAMLYEETFLKSIEIHERNKELDDFTYVVSHDLKEPLLSIEGFSKILFNDFAAGLGDEGADYLHSITESCRRMKTLISDLLELSRVGRASESLVRVSLEEVLSELEKDFEFSLSDRNAELCIQHPLPEIIGNRTHCALVFRNLISNALKFNLSPTPRVEVGWDEDPLVYRFWVHDNGIGIDGKYFDKIFIIFQRLHPVEDYEGTGAGLTIVKKAVELHKGKVWVTSKVGEGSTFYFTVPK